VKHTVEDQAAGERDKLKQHVSESALTTTPQTGCWSTHWHSIHILVPGNSPFVHAWLRIWASKIIVWGIGCLDALTCSTMVTCPFFPEAHYRTSFVPLTATMFGGLGSSDTPLSSTLSQSR